MMAVISVLCKISKKCIYEKVNAENQKSRNMERM